MAGKARFVAHDVSEGLLNRVAWRREPAVLRQAIGPDQIDWLNTARITRWISASQGYRVFVDADATRPGIRARRVPAGDASAIWAALEQSSLRFTILLNGIERLDPALVTLRDQLRVPYHWRADDVVATVSAPGSGIGYHAGHEDAVIIQIAGKRAWRVWDQGEVDADLRRALTMNQLADAYRFPPPRTPSILDCELSAGDALYIPPFFPHQGVTLERSISIAFGWRGVTFKNIADALAGIVLPPPSQRATPEVFNLVDDFNGEPADAECYIRGLAKQLLGMGYSIASDKAFVCRVMTILGSSRAVSEHNA